MPLITSAGLMIYALSPTIFPNNVYIGLLIGAVLFGVGYIISGLAESYAMLLVGFSFVGGLANAFSDKKADWAKEFKELKELLTDEEYSSARGSTLNAHYTDISVTLWIMTNNKGARTVLRDGVDVPVRDRTHEVLFMDLLFHTVLKINTLINFIRKGFLIKK